MEVQNDEAKVGRQEHRTSGEPNVKLPSISQREDKMDSDSLARIRGTVGSKSD